MFDIIQNINNTKVYDPDRFIIKILKKNLIFTDDELAAYKKMIRDSDEDEFENIPLLQNIYKKIQFPPRLLFGNRRYRYSKKKSLIKIKIYKKNKFQTTDKLQIDKEGLLVIINFGKANNEPFYINGGPFILNENEILLHHVTQQEYDIKADLSDQTKYLMFFTVKYVPSLSSPH